VPGSPTIGGLCSAETGIVALLAVFVTGSVAAPPQPPGKKMIVGKIIINTLFSII
jgi:hypothetical protein